MGIGGREGEGRRKERCLRRKRKVDGKEGLLDGGKREMCLRGKRVNREEERVLD